MFNTVRRMTDTDLTLLPLSKMTFQVAYAQTSSRGRPESGGYTIARYSDLSKNFSATAPTSSRAESIGSPCDGTKLSFEQRSLTSRRIHILRLIRQESLRRRRMEHRPI